MIAFQKRSVVPVGLVVVLGAALTGCAAPRVEPNDIQPQVYWNDIESQPITAVSNGYRLLSDKPTEGLFPSSMAVTRVAVATDDPTSVVRTKTIVRDPRNEFLRWNAALDDQMAVSEVFPIDKRDLGGAEAEPEHVLAAFRALHARVGLIYAFNQLGDDESEMFGAIYDVESASPLAALHAHAVSTPIPDNADSDERANLWQHDSRALVRADFQKHVYDCVRELIARDVPATVEAPTGWAPVAPTRPVEWPPRRQSSGW